MYSDEDTKSQTNADIRMQWIDNSDVPGFLERLEREIIKENNAKNVFAGL